MEHLLQLKKIYSNRKFNTKKISGTERVASVAMMGIFSKKINKSFKCNACGEHFKFSYITSFLKNN